MFNKNGNPFKIKNIVLSYQIPVTLTQSVKIGRARVYYIVYNIATFKSSNIPNPEMVGHLGQYTGGFYPSPTKVILWLDIQFALFKKVA